MRSILRRYDLRAVAHELRFRSSRNAPQRPPALGRDKEPLVSVLCASNRPEHLEHVISMYAAQTWSNKQLVVIANATPYNLSPLDQIPGAQSALLPAAVSLGNCLNAGRKLSDGEIVVRFDDDDWYATTYLEDLVATFKSVDAQIIGKHEYYAFVESAQTMVRRFPDRSHQYVGRLAGGTIAELRSATAGVDYPDLTLGEDVAFIRRCERRGLRIWAAEPRGYIQTRSNTTNHTWTISDDDFMASTILIDANVNDLADFANRGER